MPASHGNGQASTVPKALRHMCQYGCTAGFMRNPPALPISCANAPVGLCKCKRFTSHQQVPSCNWPPTHCTVPARVISPTLLHPTRRGWRVKLLSGSLHTPRKAPLLRGALSFHTHALLRDAKRTPDRCTAVHGQVMLTDCPSRRPKVAKPRRQVSASVHKAVNSLLPVEDTQVTFRVQVAARPPQRPLAS